MADRALLFSFVLPAKSLASRSLTLLRVLLQKQGQYRLLRKAITIFNETEEAKVMTRKEVYKEIEQMFGPVPGMFQAIPDSSLELEWQLFKRVQFDEGPIPNKYRELIGVVIAAVGKCRYCSYYHTELAKLNGASRAEIEDAVHYAKSSAGWSA